MVSAHSGASVVLPDAVLSAGTTPPPNAATSVNVCSSPPLFVATIRSPLRIVNALGSKCHAATLWFAFSSVLKDASVVPPALVQVPAAMPALNDAESQASTMLTAAFDGGTTTFVSSLHAVINIGATAAIVRSIAVRLIQPNLELKKLKKTNVSHSNCVHVIYFLVGFERTRTPARNVLKRATLQHPLNTMMRLFRLAVLALWPIATVGAQSAAISDRVLGTWAGVLPTGGIQLRLGLTFTRDSAGLHGVLTSIDQNNAKIPMTVVVRNDSVIATATRANIVYAATVVRDSLRGTFTQGARFHLAMARVAELPSNARAQDPKAPFPYSAIEVAIPSVPGVTLAGTLTLPTGRGPFPAVVLVTGSGPQDRNEELLGHRPFLVIADYLTRHGIAVLRYDDRGVGKSTGNFAAATSADFANDAEAAFKLLRARGDIMKDRVGIMGHSEGGMIAPMIAARNKDVGFVVLLAGPGLPGDSIMLMQAALIGRAQGAPPAAIERGAFVNSRLFAAVKAAKDSASASVAYDSAAAQVVASLPLLEQGLAKQQLVAAKPQLLAPWMRYFIKYDPRPALRALKMPVLALDGSLDLQVPPKEDLAQIDTALKAAGNRDYRVVELPRLNHLFQTTATGNPNEYASIEETFSPAALQLIADWIAAHAGIKP